MAQLAQQSPEVRTGSNPVIVKFYNEHILLLTVEKTKIKEKEAEDT